MVTGKVKIYRMGQLVRDPGRASQSSDPVPRPSAGRILFLLEKVQSFVHSGLHLIGCSPPTLWRKIYITQSPPI